MTVYVKRSRLDLVNEDGAMLVRVARGETLKAVGASKNIGIERTRQRIAKVLRLIRGHCQAYPEYQAAVGIDDPYAIGSTAANIRDSADVLVRAVALFGDYLDPQIKPSRLRTDSTCPFALASWEVDAYKTMGWTVPDLQLRYLMHPPKSWFETYVQQYCKFFKTLKPQHLVFLNNRGEIREEVKLRSCSDTVIRYVRERMVGHVDCGIFINGRLFYHGNLTYLAARTWTDVFAAESQGVSV
jgi:hypothetical protein